MTTMTTCASTPSAPRWAWRSARSGRHGDEADRAGGGEAGRGEVRQRGLADLAWADVLTGSRETAQPEASCGNPIGGKPRGCIPWGEVGPEAPGGNPVP